MDERQKNNIISAMAKVFIVVYLAIVAYALFKFLYSFDITSIVLELIIIVVAPILVLVLSHGRNKNKIPHFPMTIAKVAVLPDSTKEASIGRLKAYTLDAVGFSLSIVVIEAVFYLWEKLQPMINSFSDIRTVLDKAEYILQNETGRVVKYLMLFAGEVVFTFVVLFIMDYIMYESKARKYRKYTSSSD